MDPQSSVERRLQATVTPSERQRARRDAWQVLQLLQLAPVSRGHEAQADRADRADVA